MSGHSKWATIRRKKARNDQARGRVFSRLTKEIIVAARDGGGDPALNARLRTAIDNAKGNNLPAENIERAIRRGTGDLPGVAYEEAWYEGYAPHGVAVLIHTLTDNRNRTVGEVRHIFSKYGGSMAESGSVAWQFDARGTLVVEAEGVDEEELLMIALEAGADDLQREEDIFVVTCPVEALEQVKQGLQQGGVAFRDAQISHIPKNWMTLDPAQQGTVLRVLEALEENDDVQNIYTNLDIDPDAAVADDQA